MFRRERERERRRAKRISERRRSLSDLKREFFFCTRRGAAFPLSIRLDYRGAALEKKREEACARGCEYRGARKYGEDSALSKPLSLFRSVFFLCKPSALRFFLCSRPLSLSLSLSLHFLSHPFLFCFPLLAFKQLETSHFLAAMGVIFTEPKYPVVNKAPAFWETGKRGRKREVGFRFDFRPPSPISSCSPLFLYLSHSSSNSLQLQRQGPGHDRGHDRPFGARGALDR